MRTHMRNLLAPPVFPEDETRTRHAETLNLSALLALALLPVGALGVVLGPKHPPATLVSLGIWTAAAGAALVLLRRGAVRAAGVLFLSSSLLGATAVAASVGTIRAPVTFTYLLVVMLAGLLFSVRGLVTAGVASSAALAGIVAAARLGWLRRPNMSDSITLVVGAVIEIFWIAGVMYSANRTLRRAPEKSEQEVAARRRAEIAAQEGQARFRAFMDNLPGAASIKDTDGRTIFINRFLANFLGVADWEGRHTTELIPGDVGQRMADDDRKAMDSGPLTLTETLPDAHGSPRTFETVKFPILVQGAETLLGGIALDVTDRHEIAAKLHAHNRILQESQQVAHLGSYELDVTTGTWTSSEGMDEVFGITGAIFPRTVEGWTGLVHPDDRDSMRRYLLDTVLGGKGRFDREYRIIRPSDGAVRWVHGLGRLDLDETGAVVSMIGTIQDITERKRAEDLLKSSEALYSSLVENLPQSVFRKDLDGRFTFANRLFCQGVGRPLDRILGATDGDLFSPDLAAKYRSDDRRVIATGTPLEQVEAHVAPDGSKLSVQVVKTPLHDPEGRIVGVQGIFCNVTSQVRAQEEIRRLNEDLERRVALRTEELELAVKELEAFSYSVSHDLRAPLRAIDGFTSILQEHIGDTLGAEPRRLAALISQNARKMGQLIDDILELSRLGRTTLAPTLVDMRDLAQAVYSEMAPLIRSDKMEFHCGELPQAVGDPVLLRQVWANLIGNAVKYTAKRERPRIEVSGEQKEGVAVYAVRDNGAGFDMAQSHNLFRIFHRLHHADDFEGTGVGLAIVSRLVQRHGGKVRAEGVPDGGATFYFELPITPPPVA